MFERKERMWIVLVACLALAFGALGCEPGAVGDEQAEEGLSLTAHRPDVSSLKKYNHGDVCEAIEEKYAGLTERAGVCQVDDDCQMLQGHCGVGLGGCYEFVNHSLEQGELDALGQRYAESGCTGAVCSCLPPYFDISCQEGRCVGEFQGFEPTCDDLAGEDFGACAMVLGWGVVDGGCQLISGCNAGYVSLFDTLEECELACTDQVPSDHCDDGSMLMCLMPIPPCGPGEIAAIKNGCYECVNEITCQPWGEPGCRVDADCQAGQHCDDCATSSCYECDDCVAGCVDQPIGPECYVDADCQTHSDYCGSCYCLALGIEEEPPYCDPDDIVYCIADPCMNKDAVCARGICHVIDAKADRSVGQR